MVRIISANYITNYASIWGWLTPQLMMLHRKNLEVRVSKIALVKLWLEGTQRPVMGVLITQVNTDLWTRAKIWAPTRPTLSQTGWGECNRHETHRTLSNFHEMHNEFTPWLWAHQLRYVPGSQDSQCRHHSQSRINSECATTKKEST